MNQETYEALKTILKWVEIHSGSEVTKERFMLESWIDEVAKEYDEDNECTHCGKHDGNKTKDCSWCGFEL
jgi:hypothetical protein